jgi:uncharacterized membrane protein
MKSFDRIFDSPPHSPACVELRSSARGTESPSRIRPRLDVLDLLRGLVMIVMVLDHTRDFLGRSASNPRDVTESALFLTRWITHYCAPTFVFLAGISAFLYGSRGRSTGEVSRFLLTRGLWLAALEITVIKFAGTFSVRPDIYTLQVIWAIGWAMVALSALVFLPRWAVATFALIVVGGHNLLDAFKPADFGGAAWIWNLLHVSGIIKPVAGTTVYVLYPVLPWIGVIAAGYAFGPIMLLETSARRRWALALGAGAIVLFVALRATGAYGDPAARVHYDNLVPTLLSYLNCEKYPPSLHYLLMTLGPALLVLGLVGEVRGKLAGWVVTFGRVPMFYYVLHLFVVHAIAIVYAFAAQGDAAWLFTSKPFIVKPAIYGLSLPLVYLVWIGIVVTLYPACRSFAAVKQRRRDWWLSYL